MSEQNIVAVETDKPFGEKCADCIGKKAFSKKCYTLPACGEIVSGKNLVFKLKRGEK